MTFLRSWPPAPDTWRRGRSPSDSASSEPDFPLWYPTSGLVPRPCYMTKIVIYLYLLCRPTYSLSPVHWPCINTDRHMTTIIMLYNEPQYCWRSDFQLLGYSFDEFTAHFPGFHTTTKINESFPRFSFILNRPRTRYI